MIQPEVVFKNIALENAETSTWTVPESLPYFDGHFPGQPILPAVAMVDASTYILQRFLKKPDLALKTVSHAKFMSPIPPGTEVRIVLQKRGESEWQFDWKENSSDRLLATLWFQV